VLSKFGLVPAALIGLDIKRLLAEAARMTQSCEALVPPSANPGVRLGVALGVLARDFKRDKITIVASRSIASMGAWLEQLLAESTGKQGKGFIPIDGEILSGPESYGDDRVFVHLHLSGDDDCGTQLQDLQERGHPVLRLAIEDTLPNRTIVHRLGDGGRRCGRRALDQSFRSARCRGEQAAHASIDRSHRTRRISSTGAARFCAYGVAVYADTLCKEEISRAPVSR